MTSNTDPFVKCLSILNLFSFVTVYDFIKAHQTKVVLNVAQLNLYIYHFFCIYCQSAGVLFVLRSVFFTFTPVPSIMLYINTLRNNGVETFTYKLLVRFTVTKK